MGTKSNSTTRFELGQLYVTPNAQAALERYQINPLLLLGRHMTGDWGDVCSEDAKANEEALQLGGRLFSVYVLPSPQGMLEALAPIKVWIITEADRSATTLLLPEDY
ncbi:MAG: type I restriction endonuclease subunit M [Methylobacter sp.]|uniref:type I restriction endonuclease subunit M n=1 Tax=Methylobacter sp. TaxID=2051955 RepID=UPI0025D01C48|nr:type I restriction endonuclease subunit M [Methylobacter sp.]MCK9619146.1 type I restriction endonuclease subunit M [Methylobacter sp.]